MNRAHSEPPFLEYPSQPELAIAALLHLLTRVADKSSAAITEAIAAHLDYIANDQRNAAALREAAQRMASDWMDARRLADKRLH